MKILILNGPNLNLLGSREPEIYGSLTLDQIQSDLVDAFPDVQLEFAQSNQEGEIIDAIQGADKSFDGIGSNPGAYAHYALAIADAVAAISTPVVEVHLSNLYARESARHSSVTARACIGCVMGLGATSYALGVRALQAHIVSL